MPQIFVQMLPSLMQGTSLESSTAVVIDVLRASTTMIHALAQGARAVIPCLNVEDAHQAAAGFPPHTRLLGGERHGELIPGFDLDNSPLKYTAERVAGKTVIFTTTNGTRALMECRAATRVCIGAFVNRQAIVQAVLDWGHDLQLICAGTDGQLTAEDILFAGAIASDLLSISPEWALGNVQAQMAADYYQARGRSPELFRDAFFGSLGAQNLLELGMADDIERAMEQDLFTAVPVWNPATGAIGLNSRT